MSPADAHVAILSSDSLLRELLGDLLRHEGFHVAEAETVEALAEMSRTAPPTVIVIDSVDDPRLGEALLADPGSIVGDPAPALLLLAGSATAAEVTANALLDCVLLPPLETGRVVHAVRAATVDALRRSGVRLRAALAEGDLKHHAN